MDHLFKMWKQTSRNITRETSKALIYMLTAAIIIITNTIVVFSLIRWLIHP